MIGIPSHTPSATCMWSIKTQGKSGKHISYTANMKNLFTSHSSRTLSTSRSLWGIITSNPPVARRWIIPTGGKPSPAALGSYTIAFISIWTTTTPKKTQGFIAVTRLRHARNTLPRKGSDHNFTMLFCFQPKSFRMGGGGSFHFTMGKWE